MSLEPQSRRERRKRTSKPAKVQPITESSDLLAEGLPCDLYAERFVLGSVLLDSSRFNEVGSLTQDDFSLERHRRVFTAMRDLHDSGENIDYVTVADRLQQRHGPSQDVMTFLTSLDDGVPRVPHLESWVRILRKKTSLRRTIFESDKLMKECLVSSADPAQILADHVATVATLREGYDAAPAEIRRVEDLESIFADRSPTAYLVKPELPVKAIVCLTGDSESGKTTLACAWARDAFRQGHAVLLLDRDKNPRDRVCDRLERLGIQSDGERFRIWDCEQNSDPPQPDDPVIVDWVKRMVAATGKSPLVVLDALVNFFTRDEDENSAVDMRALFNRCRVLAELGATVILIHHTNRNGEARGSSDFKPASDQAFLVSNCDRDGGRLLDMITLHCEKSRYGLSGRIEYHYAGGKMLRIEGGPPSKPAEERLRELLIANPGILAEAFQELASGQGVGRNQARKFLKGGERAGTVSVQAEGRKLHHYWCCAEHGHKESDVQGSQR